jgi:acid phosphatase
MRLIFVANLQWLAKQGITLTNYHGVAHPSQPNYVAVVGGSQNKIISGLVGDIPKKMETIVDRLEAKGITWGEYQEGLPYTGFLGDYKNHRNGRNDYVRKHK